jgi:hypothetical protein
MKDTAQNFGNVPMRNGDESGPHAAKHKIVSHTHSSCEPQISVRPMQMWL